MCISATKANSKLFFIGGLVVKLGQLLTRAKFSSFNFKIKPAVDSRYSWVVCVSSFILQFFVFGVNNSFGTLFLELLKDFKRSESATAWIGSMTVGVTYLIAPITTSLIHRWGCRVVACIGSILFAVSLVTTSLVHNMSWMYFTYGLLMGLASSCLYFSSFVSLLLYFEKRLALASGISMSAVGFGTMSLSLLLEKCYVSYGWRVSMRWFAGTAVLVFFAGLVYIPIDREEKGLKEKWTLDKGGTKERHPEQLRNCLKLSKPESLKNKHFLVWCTALGLVSIAYYIPYTYLGRISADIGARPEKGALLVGLLTLSQTVGKIVAGNSMDRKGINRLAAVQLCTLVIAVSTCLLPLATVYSTLVAYVIVTGFVDGFFVILFGLVTRDILGQRLLSKGIGLLFGFMAVPLTIGAPIAGFIYDNLGSYNPVFFLTSGLITLGSCLMFLIPWSHLIERQNLQAKQEISPSQNSIELPELSQTSPESFKKSLLVDDSQEKILENERNYLLDVGFGQKNASRPSSVIFFGIVPIITDDDFTSLSNGDDAGQFLLSDNTKDITCGTATQTSKGNKMDVKIDFHLPSSWKTALVSPCCQSSDSLNNIPSQTVDEYSCQRYSDVGRERNSTTGTLNNYDSGYGTDEISLNSETSEMSWKCLSQDTASSVDSGYVDSSYTSYSTRQGCSVTSYVDDSLNSSTSDKNDFDICLSHKDMFNDVLQEKINVVSNDFIMPVFKPDKNTKLKVDNFEGKPGNSQPLDHDQYSKDIESLQNIHSLSPEETPVLWKERETLISGGSESGNYCLVHNSNILPSNPVPMDFFSRHVEKVLENHNLNGTAFGGRLHDTSTEIAMCCYSNKAKETQV